MKNLSRGSQRFFLAFFMLADVLVLQFVKNSRADRVFHPPYDLLITGGFVALLYSLALYQSRRFQMQFSKPMFAVHFFVLLFLYLFTISCAGAPLPTMVYVSSRYFLIALAVITGLFAVVRKPLHRSLLQFLRVPKIPPANGRQPI